MAAADTAPALSAALWRGPTVLRREAKPTRKPAPPCLAEEAVGFQDELEDLINEPPPPLLRGAHWLLALLFLALLAWACIALAGLVTALNARKRRT